MNIEQKVAEMILESGARVPIPAPLFLRLLGKKQVKVLIRQPSLGTLMHISRLATSEGFDLKAIDSGNIDAVHQLVAEHGKTVCRIMAVAILNRKTRIKLFSRMLAKWLEKLNTRKVAEITMTIILMSGYQDFTNSIRLIRGLRMTAPRNLSPTEQGSNEDEREDSIAPGEPSGA